MTGIERDAHTCEMMERNAAANDLPLTPLCADLRQRDALPAGAPVVDLIYAPAETELLRRAREGGHQTANGFGLLVNQAVLSLEHFTGTAIDAAEMKRRLADVLLP